MIPILAVALATVAITIGDDPAPVDDQPPPAWWFVIGIASLMLGACGATTAACLLVFSPAKLGRSLNGDAESVLARLSRNRASYQVLARSIAVIGATVAGVTLWHASPTTEARILTMFGFGLLAVVSCGVMPGCVAEHRAEATVVAAHPTLEWMRRLLHYPALVPLMAIGQMALRLARLRKPPTNADGLADDILAAVEDRSFDSGLDEDERSWIENIVELKDTDASAVMTPRTDIIAFDQQMPLLDAIREATRAGFSRFPVYDQKVDNVVGVFYAKDALPLIEKPASEAQSATVGEYVRKPLFVPETMDVADLLHQFRSSRVQMAIVLDEYGGTAGLVSIEDVLEEIVGDISDEYDPDEELPIKVIEAGRVFETSGRVRIEDLNAVLPVGIPEAEDYDTVAGFVFTSLDRIPRVHEHIAIGDVEVEVLEGDERRIHRLRLTVSAAKLNA